MVVDRRTLLSGGLALGGLSVLPARSQAQRARTALTAAYTREVLTLDGNYANLRENDILGLLIDDALFAVDPASGTAVPLAAKSYAFRDDRTLVFELRDDVTFHDGSRLSVEDVAYTFNYMLDATNNNSYQDRFDRWLAKAEPGGGGTVVLRMKQPYAMALFDLAMYCKLRRVDAYKDPGKPNGIDPDALALRHNGTGPYRVVDFKPAQSIRLERVGSYRAGGPKGSPPLTRIDFRVIPDWATQAAEVVSGGVHWTFDMPEDIAQGAAATGQAQLASGPSLRVFYISLDAAGKTQKDGPLTKLAVRRALNHAIDRQGIVDAILGGKARILGTPCDPTQFGCTEDDITRYAYDPQAAKRLLAEAGYAGGFDLELWASRDKSITEAIVAQWRAVGVRANLRYVKGPTLTEARRQQKIAAEWASSGSFGIPDAGALMPDRLGPDSFRNYSGDAQMSQSILAAVSTYDPEARKKDFAAAIRRCADQAYWVPMYTDEQNFLMANGLRYAQAKDGMQRLYTARWA